MSVSFDTVSIWSLYSAVSTPFCAVTTIITSDVFLSFGNVYTISPSWTVASSPFIDTFAYALFVLALITNSSNPASAVT